MKRTPSQIFFNHLPGQMQRDTGSKLITEVMSVTYAPAAATFKTRIMELAKQYLEKRGLAGPQRPFIDAEYSLVTASNATQQICPALLRCNSCGHVQGAGRQRFVSQENLPKYLARCGKCGDRDLEQLDLVVIHECGLLDQPEIKRCHEKDHGYRHIVLDRGLSQAPKDYEWKCAQCGRTTGPFFSPIEHRGCEFDYETIDGKKKSQKATVSPYRARGVFRRQGFELVNHSMDEVLRARDNPLLPPHLFKVHLGLAGSTDFLQGLRQQEDGDQMRRDAQKIEAILSFNHKQRKDLPALRQAEPKLFASIQEYATRESIDLARVINPPGDTTIGATGLNTAVIGERALVDELLDYYQLFQSTYRTIGWDAWADTARGIPTFNLSLLENTKQTLGKLGFSDAYYVQKLPIANVAIGFERGRLKSTHRKLVLFPSIGEEDPRRPFYVHTINTEAILFQLKATEIVAWLAKQDLPDHSLPSQPTEREARVLLLNHLNTKALVDNKFDPIDDPFADRLYSLLHTMSHSLIKTINPFSGDDSGSMGEIIFPHIPAFAVYLRKQTEYTSGTIAYLYQRNLENWLYAAQAQVASCMNDPSCRKSDGPSSCFGCLQSSEIACARFNNSLDRELLYDFGIQRRVAGFWPG